MGGSCKIPNSILIGQQAAGKGFWLC